MNMINTKRIDAIVQLIESLPEAEKVAVSQKVVS
jgi:hypothetical protein